MFFSKDKKILELINLHLKSVENCFNVYSTFLHEVLNKGLSEKADLLGKDITELESAADTERHQIIRELLGGALLPDLRRELLNLIEKVDGIANTVEEISKQIILQKINFPNELNKYIIEIDHKEKEQFEILYNAVNMLFGNAKEVKESLQLIQLIELKESEVDDLENTLVKTLYRLDLTLAEKNQLKVILSKTADVSDVMEDISDILEIIIAIRAI